MIAAALIARESVQNYREQRKVDNENYRRQRETDRREEVAKRQREAYEHYLEAWWNVNNLAGTEFHERAQAVYQTARDVLFFYASDEGLNRINDFHQYVVHTPTDKYQDTVEDLLAKMMLTLRKDCYGETNLTLDEIKSKLTISV